MSFGVSPPVFSLGDNGVVYVPMGVVNQTELTDAVAKLPRHLTPVKYDLCGSL